MLVRLLTLLLIVLLAAAAWAKPKFDAQSLVERSDALYYYPQDHGLTDLAVDLSVEQFGTESVAGKAQVTVCYLNGRRELLIGNVPDVYKSVRDSLYNMMAPLGEYVAPKKSVENFAGMKLKAVRVYRQLTGLPEGKYFQVYGLVEDEKAPLKEYRVLVDENGLAHQVETEAREGGTITARLENTQIENAWVVSKISTRLGTAAGPVWEIATITFQTIEGFILPVQVQTQHRNGFNQPVKEMPDLTIKLVNYRINQGAAAALLATPPAQP